LLVGKKGSSGQVDKIRRCYKSELFIWYAKRSLVEIVVQDNETNDQLEATQRQLMQQRAKYDEVLEEKRRKLVAVMIYRQNIKDSESILSG